MFWSLLLLFVAKLVSVGASFPNGSCRAQSCSGSPYTLQWTLTADKGPFCFTVTRADSCVGPCCDVFEKLLQKIVIKSSPMCKPAFQKVTQNGVKKGGGVFFDLYGAGEAELRMTALKMNVTTAPSTLFCIYANGPCASIDAFCGGPCLYSVYDPFTHNCCPTCMLLGETIETPMFLTSPPPPFPLPPSPWSPPPSPEPEPEAPSELESSNQVLMNCTCNVLM